MRALWRARVVEQPEPDGDRKGYRHQDQTQRQRTGQYHGVTPERQRAHVDTYLRSWAARDRDGLVATVKGLRTARA